MMRKLTAIALASCVFGLACGGSNTSSGDDIDAAEARTALVEHVRLRSGAAATYGLARTFAEHLPNVRFQSQTGTVIQPQRSAVIGQVVDAEPGRAFLNPVPGSGESSTQLDSFDDRTADWRTLHLIVDVTETFGEDVGGRRLRVGMPISGNDDPYVLLEGARALGRVVLLLDDSTDLFAYDPDVIGMVLGGEYLMTVAEDGTVDLPMMEPEMDRAFLGDLRSVEDVRRAATEPTKVIPVVEDAPGYYYRTDG